MKYIYDEMSLNSLVTDIGRATILLCLASFALLSFLSTSRIYTQTKPVIAVVKSMDVPQYDRTLEGFREILQARQRSVTSNEFYLTDPNLIRSIKSQNPALIITLGTSAAKLVSRNISDVPIIFSVIMDPKGSKLSSGVSAGASVDIPAKLQMDRLKMVMPGLKRIGVIYNPAENETIIREARKTAAELGLELKAFPVRSKREIPRLGELSIDILWMIPDTLVNQPAIIKRFILTGLRRKIPVMGYSRSFARAGALLAVSCDYTDIGRQTGEIAVRLLQGENYSSLTISKPRKVKLYLNKIVADRLGIKLPKKIIKLADEVFGQ